MFDEINQSEKSFKNVDFSGLSLYQLEAIKETHGYTDNTDLRKSVSEELKKKSELGNVGDEVFQCLFEGLEKEDEYEIAWSMARISHLIHENVIQDEKQKRANLQTYRKITPKYFSDQDHWVKHAKGWINGDRNRIPIGFSTGSQNQRIYRYEENHEIYFGLPISPFDLSKHPYNSAYYESFLGLFGIQLQNNLSDSTKDELMYELPGTKVKLKVEDGELHSIEVYKNKKESN